MPIVLMAAALIGALITFAALWPLGLLVALLGAPIGASATTVIVAQALKRYSRKPSKDKSD